MRIVLINTSERNGGAAVAASRLKTALQKAGEEVTLLVRDKQTEDPDVVSINSSSLKKHINTCRFLWERFVIFVCNKLKRKNLFQVSLANTGTDISKHPLVKEADIIHLHWINQGLLSRSDIQKLIQTGKPVVWTLHDLWPATGICHYPDECGRYMNNCFSCPKQIEHPLWDMACRNFRKKEKIAFNAISFIGCSQWIKKRVEHSKLLEKSTIISLPNPIDRNAYKPVDMLTARAYFGLPKKRNLILFAAARLSDTRKGAAYLVEACRILKNKGVTEIDVVLMGNSSEELTAQLPYRVHELGYISDEETMRGAYSCADLFVIPSLEDNLPNILMEAMACGTPSVGFETGGIPEMIDHRKNGYVARYKDAADLAEGIVWVLENKEELSLSSACIEKVASSYDEETIAKKHIDFYESLLEKNKIK